MTATQTQTEHRHTERRPTLRGGHIVFNGGRSSIDCRVRNVSKTGANLAVTSIIGVPDEFVLVLPDTKRLPCRVAWRKSREIGVEFTDF